MDSIATTGGYQDAGGVVEGRVREGASVEGHSACVPREVREEERHLVVPVWGSALHPTSFAARLPKSSARRDKRRLKAKVKHLRGFRILPFGFRGVEGHSARVPRKVREEERHLVYALSRQGYTPMSQHSDTISQHQNNLSRR